MNIDKVALEQTWVNRSDPKQYRELLKYIDTMARYFASRLKISMNDRDDMLQDVRMCTIKVIDRYQPSRKSTVFSFFYRTIYNGFLYYLRKQFDKSKRSVKSCSYDVISNTVGDDDNHEYYSNLDYSSSEDSLEHAVEENAADVLVEVGGRYYVKEVIVKAAEEAKKLYKKKDLNPKTIEDELVRLCYVKLQEKSKKRKSKKLEKESVREEIENKEKEYEYKSVFEDDYRATVGSTW